VALVRMDEKNNGHTLSLAITLNRLSFDSDATTGPIVRVVYEKLGLPVPAQFVGKKEENVEVEVGVKVKEKV
jgi:hypothetical protein